VKADCAFVFFYLLELMDTLYRVVFPGAVNSEFTSDMSFITAKDLPTISTYRVMNSDGEMVDKTRAPPNVSVEEVLTWYKNMLQGMINVAPI
jgi:hypothetical protein